MREWLLAVWHCKWLVISLTIAGLVAGVAIAYLLPPVYRSTIVVRLASERENAAASVLGSGIGQLATLAGVSLGGTAEKSEFLAYLAGRSFTTRFIRDQDLAPKLFSELWDKKSARWRNDIGSPPTLEDAYIVFDRDVRMIREDKLSGLVSVSIYASDPELAAEWANGLVEAANTELRNKARAEAERSIKFLQRELEQASLLELRESIFRLLESQVTTIMLANVRQDYAFKVVDPAMPSDRKRFIRPRRLLTILLGGALGALLGALVAVVWRASRRVRVA